MEAITTDMTNVDQVVPVSVESHHPKVEASGKFAINGWDWLVGLLPLVGMSPLLYRQAISLTDVMHIAYVPLVLAVVIGYSIYHMTSTGAIERRRMVVAFSLFCLSLAIYAIAVWNYSPWLSHVAAIVGFVAWALGRWGNVDWPRAAGVGLLLATTLAWPYNADDRFAGWLEQTAAGIAASALDGFSVANHTSSEYLLTKSVQIEIAEASGYGSVFALFALVALLGLVRHRSFSHCLLLAVASPIWLVTAMSALMLVCVWTTQSYGLGMQTMAFVAALVSLLLTDQFLSVMLRPVPVSDPDSELQFVLSNLLLCWPQRDPMLDELPEDPMDREEALQLQELAEQERQTRTMTTWNALVQVRWGVPIVAALFVALGVLPALVLARSTPPPTFRALTDEDVASVSDFDFDAEDAFPARVGNWMRVRLTRDAVVRSADGYRLQFAVQGQLVDVRVVFPKSGWDGRVTLPDKNAEINLQRIAPASERGWQMAVAEATNPFGGKRYVWQTALRDDLKPFRPLVGEERLQRQEAARIPVLQMLSPLLKADESPTYHITADYEAGRPLTDAEQLGFQDSFEEFCELLRGKFKPGRLAEFEQQ